VFIVLKSVFKKQKMKEFFVGATFENLFLKNVQRLKRKNSFCKNPTKLARTFQAHIRAVASVLDYPSLHYNTHHIFLVM
jgi:hypothetical protein